MRRLLLAAVFIPILTLAQSSIFFATNWSGPQAANPSFSPGAGTYNDTQSVTISTTPSACNSYIYWNTTGAPTTGDTHSASASVTVGETLYAKVIGCPGYGDSGVGSAAYGFTVASLSFSPASGSYSGTQSVTVSSPGTTGATYCTTLDGSDPAAATPGTCSAGTPGATRSVSASATLKALGTKAGYTNSAVASSAYTIGAGSPISQDGSLSTGGVAYSPTTSMTDVDSITTSGTNRLVVVRVYLVGSSISAVTVTGSTLGTFHLLGGASSAFNGDYGYQYTGVFAAWAATALAGETITAAWTGSAQGEMVTAKYANARNMTSLTENVDYASAWSNFSDSSAVTHPTVSLTTKAAGSWVIGYIRRNNEAATNDAGTTAEISGGGSFYLKRSDNPITSSGTSVALGVTGSTGGYAIERVVEILRAP